MNVETRKTTLNEIDPQIGAPDRTARKDSTISTGVHPRMTPSVSAARNNRHNTKQTRHVSPQARMASVHELHETRQSHS